MPWQNIPFSPRRAPIFYGWVILAVATIGTLASMPGQTNGVSVFTDFLIEALGVTRSELAMAYMFGTIGSSVMLPFAGALIDRRGARVSVVLASLGLAAGLGALSQVDRITVYLGGEVWKAMCVASFCYLLVRFFGQGFLTMVSRVMIGKWFNHRRGLASAIAGIFLTYGFNSAPWLLDNLVQRAGWRETCLLLAIATGGGMSLLGWLFYRDNPEECGLVMDGVDDPEWHARMEARVPSIRKEFTRQEACRTWAFWALTLGVSSFALIITAAIFHLSSIGETMGLDRDGSFALLLYVPYFSIASNFYFGWLSDRIRLKWLLAAKMAFLMLALYGLLHADTAFGKLLFSLGLGATGGLFNVLLTTSFPRYFGRLHLGAISGRNMAVMVFASAIGPYLFSMFYDAHGDYRLVLWLSMLMPAAGFIGAFFVRNPQEAIAAPADARGE